MAQPVPGCPRGRKLFGHGVATLLLRRLPTFRRSADEGWGGKGVPPAFGRAMEEMMEEMTLLLADERHRDDNRRTPAIRRRKLGARDAGSHTGDYPSRQTAAPGWASG